MSSRLFGCFVLFIIFCSFNSYAGVVQSADSLVGDLEFQPSLNYTMEYLEFVQNPVADEKSENNPCPAGLSPVYNKEGYLIGCAKSDHDRNGNPRLKICDKTGSNCYTITIDCPAGGVCKIKVVTPGIFTPNIDCITKHDEDGYYLSCFDDRIKIPYKFKTCSDDHGHEIPGSLCICLDIPGSYSCEPITNPNDPLREIYPNIPGFPGWPTPPASPSCDPNQEKPDDPTPCLDPDEFPELQFGE